MPFFIFHSVMNVLGNYDNWLGKIIKTVQISILFFVGGKFSHTSGSVIQLIKSLSPNHYKYLKLSLGLCHGVKNA
jgi:hypothetical protein